MSSNALRWRGSTWRNRLESSSGSGSASPKASMPMYGAREDGRFALMAVRSAFKTLRWGEGLWGEGWCGGGVGWRGRTGAAIQAEL